MTLLGRWLVAAGIVAVATLLAPGLERGESITLGLVSLGIAAVNLGAQPLISALPFPVPIIALVALYFLLNALLLMAAATTVPGFGFAGWSGIAIAALLIAIGTATVLAVSGRRRKRGF